MAQVNDDSELVLGLITTVGTDVEEIISNIKDHLKKFRYSTEVVTVSRDILSQFTKEKAPEDEFSRINFYMDLGNEIRSKTGDNSILMKGVASKLYNERVKTAEAPVPRSRIAYIIKSIKHPDEVTFLRDTYGDGFHLIGITSNYNKRLDYLVERKNIENKKAKMLLERDSNESAVHGQHTQDAFQHSDYFINVTDSSAQIQHNVSRLLDLLFGDPFITPSFDEYAMFMAYVSSLRSADLSRQIGAVIAKDNEIIATGANDCPKVGGGLYWPIKDETGKYEDIENGRDHTLGYDSNKIEQKKIIDKILSNLELEASKENEKKIKNAGIGDLTEYGRVVHAEMEALLTCARNSVSCRKASLYATTFPCHNCAKHIISAGIDKVVYIEPYPKSKAFEFYKKEIADSSGENELEEDKSNQVLFIPFVGVGPHKYIDLFAVSSTKWYARKRKDKSGIKIQWKRKEANLRNPMSLFTYLESEEAAVPVFGEETKYLKEEEGSGS